MQASISGEYNYETFKPPPAAASQWDPFCGQRQAKKKFLPLQQDKVCVGFFFLPSTFGIGCLVVACLSHFRVWSRAPQGSLEQCSQGYTHFQDLSRSKAILNPENPTRAPLCSSSDVWIYRRIGRRLSEINRHTGTVWAKQLIFFFFSLTHSFKRRQEKNQKQTRLVYFVIMWWKQSKASGKEEKKNKIVFIYQTVGGHSDNPVQCNVAVCWKSTSHPGLFEAELMLPNTGGKAQNKTLQRRRSPSEDTSHLYELIHTLTHALQLIEWTQRTAVF